MDTMMHPPHEARRPASGRRSVRVTGVLDLPKVLGLITIVERTPRTAHLRIDLRVAREIHDAALVALARALAGRDAVLVGLSRHQERLLAYVQEVTGADAEEPRA